MVQALAEKLEHTGLAEKERVATENAVDRYAGAAFAKRRRNRAVCPKYPIMREERVKVGESLILARESGSKKRKWLTPR